MQVIIISRHVLLRQHLTLVTMQHPTGNEVRILQIMPRLHDIVDLAYGPKLVIINFSLTSLM